MAKNKKNPDWVLLGVVAFLILIGIAILASVSAAFSYQRIGNTYYFLNHQLLFGLLPGLILAFAAYKIDLNFFKKYAPIFLLINLIGMIAVFFPIIGSAQFGASRWLDLKIFSAQPSEFLKLNFVIYLASLLASRTEKNKLVAKTYEKQIFITFLVIILIVALLLICQSDLGTLIAIGLVACFMYFSINTPLKHIFFLALLALGGLITLIKFVPYRFARLKVFLNPDLDPMGVGYQIKQALIAIGSGGITGVGLGMSTQKFGALPQTISDSIFAIFAEETGFIGSILLIILFVIFLWQGLNLAKKSQDAFSKLLSVGITLWITFQAFINIGAMIGILPLTGIPLPFISYGGSAIISELIGIGILLNISRNKIISLE